MSEASTGMLLRDGDMGESQCHSRVMSQEHVWMEVARRTIQVTSFTLVAARVQALMRWTSAYQVVLPKAETAVHTY